jgi:hypothetical protein
MKIFCVNWSCVAQIFAMMVVMAIITTAFTPPALYFTYKKEIDARNPDHPTYIGRMDAAAGKGSSDTDAMVGTTDDAIGAHDSAAIKRSQSTGSHHEATKRKSGIAAFAADLIQDFDRDVGEFSHSMHAGTGA